jgi:hypothetical protein
MTSDEWINSLRIPQDYPILLCGWPAEERGLGKSDWESYCDDRAEECAEEGVPFMPLSYEDWYEREVEARGEEDEDTEFSWQDCDLCGALAGSRHHATAYHTDFPANQDYIALEVCGDCLCWIANGDVPNECEDG